MPELDEPAANMTANAADLGLLQSGQPIPATWPNDKVRPVGMTCDAITNTVVASTRFGLYLADLNQKSATNQIHFKAGPACEHLQGEPLQDVSLLCGLRGKACQAVVLHGQGQRLSTCDLGGSSVNASSGFSSVAGVAEEWLHKSNAHKNIPAESLVAFTMTSRCEGKDRSCAYMRTSGERVVEMLRASDGSHEWFPNRLLRAKNGRTSTMSSGSMDVVNGRYLGVLSHDRQHVEFLDLQQDGSVVNSWDLPALPEGQAWGGMCAAGDSLYFLSRGASSPELWRFPVPEQLMPEAASKEDTVEAEEKTERASLIDQSSLSSLRHNNRRWK